MFYVVAQYILQNYVFYHYFMLILFSFCSLPCLKSKQQGYVVVFMQSILSVDHFRGQVVSIFIVDQCRPQKFGKMIQDIDYLLLL